MATSFSLKQGETRTSHGPIPHPLSWAVKRKANDFILIMIVQHMLKILDFTYEFDDVTTLSIHDYLQHVELYWILFRSALHNSPYLSQITVSKVHWPRIPFSIKALLFWQSLHIKFNASSWHKLASITTNTHNRYHELVMHKHVGLIFMNTNFNYSHVYNRNFSEFFVSAM